MAKFNKRTRTEYVQGKLSWVKVVQPDTKYEPAWSVTIHPTQESLEKIREWVAEGLMNRIKKDDDGWFVRFKCPVSRNRKDGTIWTFEAPKVVDKEGRPMDGFVIGNGSDGTLKLELYEFPTPGGGNGIAARLMGLRVDNLVPFNPEADYSDEEKAEVEGLKNQPPLF